MTTLRIKMSTTLLIIAMYSFSAYANEYITSAANKNASTTSTTTPAATPSASENYLKEILKNVNKLPLYLNQLTKLAISWLTPDDSSATAILQNNFTTLTNAKLQNITIQMDSQNRFLKDFLGNPFLQNDLSYQTLLNQSYAQPNQPMNNTPDPAYTYTQYAAALNITHKAPPNNDVRDMDAIALYKNYYHTTSAIQTYNGYILSELYADAKSKNKTKQIQNTLIQTASNANWFTQVASENVGIVLRQILLYNSQTYVLLTELLETQKKLLAAQAMNNALLIAVNQETERRIYRKANGEPP